MNQADEPGDMSALEPVLAIFFRGAKVLHEVVTSITGWQSLRSALGEDIQFRLLTVEDDRKSMLAGEWEGIGRHAIRLGEQTVLIWENLVSVVSMVVLGFFVELSRSGSSISTV